MRIISGEYKGRIITKSAPRGVRPTTDQARETIFNILAGYVEWENVKVLDLCAGTGALGFEALSRGAEYCDFVEINRTTAQLIETTARNFNIETNQYAIHTIDCLTYLRTIQEDIRYSVIFTDPPYHKKLLNTIFNLLFAKSIISQGTICVAEHNTAEVVLPPEGFSLISTRNFGETTVDMFEFQT